MGRTLITGGAGYIGMLVAEELLAAGHEVRVLDSLLHRQAQLRRGAARARASSSHVGDVRDAGARAERARAASTRSCTSPRSSAIRRARCDPETAQAVNVDAALALVAGRRARRRRALRVRLDLLELRPHGRSHRADHRGRRARAGLALRGAEGRGRARAARRSTPRRSPRPACASPPSTASLRGCASTSPSTSSPATCGPTGGSRCSASSSGGPTSTSATRRAACARCSRRRSSARGRRGLQRRRQRRELPQARPRRADPPRDGSRARSSSCTAPRIRATTRWRSTRSRSGSATRSTRTVPDGIREIIAALDDGRFEDAFDGRYRNIA